MTTFSKVFTSYKKEKNFLVRCIKSFGAGVRGFIQCHRGAGNLYSIHL